MDELTPRQALKFFGILILLHASVSSETSTSETVEKASAVVDLVLKECGIE